MDGRYPQAGYDVDEQTEATWYVESGKAIICIGGREQKVEKGDMVYIPKVQIY